MSSSYRRKNIIDDDDDSDDDEIMSDLPFLEENQAPDYFNIYFPFMNKPTSELNKLITNFRKYFDENTNSYDEGESCSKYKVVYINQQNMKNGREIYKIIQKNPKDLLNVLCLIFHWKFNFDEKKYVIVRFYNFEGKSKISKLKTTKINKFISIHGTVLKCSDVYPLVTHLPYYCTFCGCKKVQFLKDGKVYPPRKCIKEGCKSRKFVPDKENAKCVDFQTIRIQESSDMNVEAGRVPRSIEVELFHDLVGKCICGDHVEVCGFLRSQTIEESIGRGRKKPDKRKYIYVEANSLTKTKDLQSKDEIIDVDLEMPLTYVPISEKEMRGIREIQKQPNIFNLVVNSICPNIFGLETIKAGVTLALFGGVQKFQHDTKRLPVRGDPHVLIVGDPGLGKSQLLISCSKRSYRGIYVCSKVSTAKGLTVTISKDDKSGDYSMEAGALVLADQGVCCIDEFDKLSKDDYKALLEAMEQQNISIAKAGIVCNLPARCSVIAAANPVGGNYDRAKTVAENIRILPAMLSRFDLVFVLLDKKDKRRDKMLSEYVLKFHSNPNVVMDDEKKRMQKLYQSNKEEKKKREKKKEIFNVGNISDISKSFKKLEEKLKIEDVGKFEPLPASLLKKYIVWTKKNCFPKLSSGAKDVLQNFYISLRKTYQDTYSTPITTRQLESLVRLAQARARLESRNVVSIEDAWDVIEIMKESFYDMLLTDKGTLDFRRSSGAVKDKDANRFLVILEKVSLQKNSNIFSKKELKQVLRNNNIQPKNGEDIFIDRLNNQGYLLMKGNSKYKLTTISLNV